jgi:hypothetical protein
MLTINAAKPGIFLLAINGTSGPNTNYQYMFVYVGDFTMSSGSNTVNLAPNGSKTFILTLDSRNNFVDAIRLTGVSNPAGLGVSFSNPSPMLTSRSSISIIVTISGLQSNPGTYNITITGTAGQLSHTSTIQVLVALPPTLIVPDSRTVNPGSLLTFYVNLTDPDPNVRLSAGPLPTGASFRTFTDTRATLTTVVGMFNWKPSAQASGDYIITFTAQDRNGGFVTRQVTIHVTGKVNPTISLPSSLTLGYGLIAIAGVAATITGGLIWRRKKLSRGVTSSTGRIHSEGFSEQ